MNTQRAEYEDQLAARLAELLIAEHRRRGEECVQNESPDRDQRRRAHDHDDNDVPRILLHSP